jgi:hypothetical protein
MKPHLIVLFAVCLPALNIQADQDGVIVAQSGPQRVSLLELYTSEGCSSCPPAEKWMASLLENESLWKNVIPISFHVDYWNYLGWKDPYSSPVFTKRQHAYASEWNTTTVYTPEFVLDGREWRGRTLPLAQTTDSPGHLVVERISPSEYRVSFQPQAGFTGGEAHLAILGFDLKSNIRSGENAGRALVHQFVVLDLAQSALAKEGAEWTAILRIPTKPPGRLALASWITPSGSNAPLQATGGWLSQKL